MSETSSMIIYESPFTQSVTTDAILLSLLYRYSFKPTEENAEKLLELADRFLLPAAKYHLEYFIISTDLNANKKLELAGKHELETLLSHALKLYKTKEELVPMIQFLGFSANVKAKILDRQIELNIFSNNINPPARDTWVLEILRSINTV